MIIPQLKAWQGGSGLWYVDYTDSFSSTIDNWLIPCRAMNMAPDKWIQWVIENFHPSAVNIREDGKFVFFSWSKSFDATRYKNTINKIIRDSKFTI